MWALPLTMHSDGLIVNSEEVLLMGALCLLLGSNNKAYLFSAALSTRKVQPEQ